MGRLTTHVLDTTRGKPGTAIALALYSIEGVHRQLPKTTLTNNDGQGDNATLENDVLQTGDYELVLAAGPYIAATQITTSSGETESIHPFSDDVAMRNSVSADDQHYHIPLLITPCSYSTYRGS